MSDSNTLAVIAGAGKFPVMVIEGAKQHGLRVVVLGLKEIADASLADIADEFYWVAPLRCLLYTSPSPRDGLLSRMPSSA